MNDLLQMRLFCLLTESSQKVTNEKIQNAFDCFMEQVKTVSQPGQDYSETFRMLNNSRIE